jgi:hypothetical protein
MNPTVRLLQAISTPFEDGTKHPPTVPRQFLALYRYSVKNRVSLPYLEALLERQNLAILKSVYREEHRKYLKTLNAITRVSTLLADKNIEHVVFKTIRPYKSTTVDIDILIFGNEYVHKKSVETLRKAGYSLVVHGPRSTTLWDPELNMGIDLYKQVSVSFITYIDKLKLVDYVTTAKLPNSGYVKTLKPEADLSCIIAHSIIKEQMYTLSEYYTFIHYLKQMNINNFLQIVKQNNITSATRTHASITALLHRAAHNTIPEELQQIIESLGEENLETTRLIKNDFETPHKYHPITIAKSLLEIAKGEKCRNSMAMQIYYMLNPRFTKKFLKDIIQHVKRETY